MIISTHTLRKEGDIRERCKEADKTLISTHTLRKEGDIATRELKRIRKGFQPTPSARRVTLVALLISSIFVISTHTLRKEGDRTDHRR